MELDIDFNMLMLLLIFKFHLLLSLKTKNMITIKNHQKTSACYPTEWYTSIIIRVVFANKLLIRFILFGWITMGFVTFKTRLK